MGGGTATAPACRPTQRLAAGTAAVAEAEQRRRAVAGEAERLRADALAVAEDVGRREAEAEAQAQRLEAWQGRLREEALRPPPSRLTHCDPPPFMPPPPSVLQSSRTKTLLVNLNSVQK